MARRFLDGYVRFAYGEAPASSVPAVEPGLRRQLSGKRALVASVERGRHPRVISLVATGPKRGVVRACALIDDGGIANYALRVTLRETHSRWLVSAVDEG